MTSHDITTPGPVNHGVTTRADRLTDLFAHAPDLATADLDEVRPYAAALLAEGLALVTVAPGSKKATLKGWQTDPITDVDTFDRRYVAGANLAVNLGASNLAVVDADTPDEVAAFAAWCRENNHERRRPDATVISPGTRTADGTVGHHGGGHWYIDLTGTFAASARGNGFYLGPGGRDGGKFFVLVGDRYALLPGSNRTDAADPSRPLYTLSGRVYTHDDFAGVVKAVAVDGMKKATKKQRPRREHDDTVDRGGESFDAAFTRLTDDGFADTGTVDGCGCPVLTRPDYGYGPAGNPKSVTLHGEGICDGDVNGAVLTVWTDNLPNLPGGDRYSLADYLLATDHGYDFARGRDELADDPDFVRDRDVLLAGLGITPCREVWGMTADGRVVVVTDNGDGLAVYDLDGEVVDLDALKASNDEHVAATARAVDTGDDTAFWSARPWLDEVRRAAFIKGVDPYAVLLTVLAEVALRVPANVIVGGKREVSLNLLTLLVGNPADGKGTAADLGRQLVARGDGNGFASPEPRTYTGFSGQGLGRVLAPRDVVPEGDDGGAAVTQPAPPARFVITETVTLTQLTKQTGATHTGVLNSFFMGEELGATNNDRSRTFSTPAHSYRGVLELEGQPDIVMPLYEGESAASGLSARLLAARVLIPEAADALRVRRLESGDMVDPGRFAPAVKVMSSAWRDIPADATGLRVFPTARAVEDMIRRDEHAAKYGQRAGASTAAHEALRRRKVAALLAIASGESALSVEWWELAGYVMAVNRAVTDGLNRDAAAKRHAAKVAARVADADVDDQAEAAALAADVTKVDEWLKGTGAKYIDGDGWVKWSKVMSSGPARRWSSARRGRVLDGLQHDGPVEVTEARGGGTEGYRVRRRA